MGENKKQPSLEKLNYFYENRDNLVIQRALNEEGFANQIRKYFGTREDCDVQRCVHFYHEVPIEGHVAQKKEELEQILEAINPLLDESVDSSEIPYENVRIQLTERNNWNLPKDIIYRLRHTTKKEFPVAKKYLNLLSSVKRLDLGVSLLRGLDDE